MRTLNVLIGLLCAAALMPSTARSAEIQILLKSGGELTADLISVRDSALVICRVLNVTEGDLQANPSLAEILPFRNIDLVKVEGHRYVGTGLAIGGLGGALIGGLIGSQVDVGTEMFAGLSHTTNTFSGVLIGGAGGLLVGAVIGNVISSPERIFDSRVTGWTTTLREHARYPRNEPKFLSTVDSSR